MTSITEQIKTIQAIPISCLIGVEYRADDIYKLMSEQSSFSWGDNDKTLISIARLRYSLSDIREQVEDDDELIDAIDRVSDSIEKLKSCIYIDLEN